MSITNHNVLIVNSFNTDAIEYIHAYAEGMFGTLVSSITPYVINGGATFMIGIDGSKEEREESDTRDRLQKTFIDWVYSQKRWGSVDENGDRWSYVTMTSVNMGEFDEDPATAKKEF